MAKIVKNMKKISVKTRLEHILEFSSKSMFWVIILAVSLILGLLAYYQIPQAEQPKAVLQVMGTFVTISLAMIGISLKNK